MRWSRGIMRREEKLRKICRLEGCCRATRADTCPGPTQSLPDRQWRLVRDSAVTRLLNRRSRSPGTFPSRCRPRSRFRQGFAESGFQAPFVARVADGTLPGPHTLHGRLCPTRPDIFSAPCAKFDSIPAKIQPAKFLRTTDLKMHSFAQEPTPTTDNADNTDLHGSRTFH